MARVFKSKIIHKKIEVKNDNLPRIIQLFNRTNQFHLSSNKFDLYSFTNKLNNSKNFFYEGIVTDRLGSEGLISVIGFTIDVPKNYIYLNEYILSCRVFDRYIEEAMLIPIFQYALDQNYKIHINFKKGLRNKKVQDFIIHKISKSNELTLSEINKFLEEFRKLPIEVNLEDIL